MKITVFLVLVAFIQTFANEAYSQKTKLSLNYSDTRLEVVLDEIEELSEFFFLANEKLVDLDRNVSITAQDKKIDEILDMLFAGTDVVYTITDRKIILAPSFLTENVQQQRSVSGKVTDSGGQPLPGVTVVVKGTTQGTVTNPDGEYTLSNILEDATLVFSFVGMRTQEVVVGSQARIDVSLEADVIGIEEVVAIGYGTRLREELSGSVSSISNEKLNISTETDAISRLQGHISGVTVSSTHTPGGTANIRIRGLGTINDSNPLYVIDGVPVGPSNNINPNDIESISVLKDASSSAIYGTRGANGVIIITTKKGKKNQQTKISFTARSGVNQAVKGYDLLNTKEYGEVLWMTAKNQGYTPGVNWTHPHYGSDAEPRIPDYILPAGAMEGDPGTSPENYRYDPFDREVYGAIIRANKEGTNWFNEITQNGVIQEYDLSISGGGNNLIHSTSASYLKENGILLNTGFERFSFRNNSESNSLANWLTIGQSLNVSLVMPKGDLSNNGEYSPIGNSLKLQPIIPVFDIQGNYAGTKPINLGESNNPVAQLERAKDNSNKYYRILGNFFAEAQIIDGLKFRSLFGYNYGHSSTLSRTIPAPEHFQTHKPAVSKANNISFQWNWSNTLDFNRTIAKNHKINVIVGTEAIENNYDWMNASRDEYFSLDPNYMQLAAGEGEQRNDGSGSEWSLFSIFGRVNYNLFQKYIIEATIRRDGSSRFGENNRFATFPAGSIAWILSEENFLRGYENWLDYLKLRIGVGASGNDRIGNYNIYSTFGTNVTYAAYDISGTNTSTAKGFMPLELGNPNVGWEKTLTYNLGMDVRVINNSLNFSVDVWQRNTQDMLYRLRIPVISGIETAPFVNIGEMKNIGFDFEIGYNNTIFNNKLKYNLTATISRYVNEVLNLSNDIEEEVIMGGYRQINYLRSAKGRAFPEFYGYIVDGYFQTQEEVNNHPNAFGDEGTYNKVGRFKYRNLNNDDVINEEDMTYIGSPHPDFTGGFNIDLAYSNFDLNIFFYGSYGNDMINLARRNIDFGMFDGNYSKDVLYRSWGSPYLDNNMNAKLPIHDLSEGSIQPSTAFVEDGSFLRLKNLRIGYSLPENLSKSILIQNLRLYGQVTNLFTISKYSGLDPELSTSTDRMGLDFGAWPTPRQILFGITIDF